MTPGCVLLPERAQWPAELPPRAYYESVYADDPRNLERQSLKKYLKWVRIFYHGWGGIRGWHSIREEILEDVETQKRDVLREDLNDLGKRISAEWAKAYRERAITGKTVQVWINAAYECSTRRDHERLIGDISRDVDALRAGRLDPAKITLERYYPDIEPLPPLDEFDLENGE